MQIKDNLSYTFECLMCGESCRVGYTVSLMKEDVIKWRNLETYELLDQIIINPECISLNYGTYCNSKDGETIVELKKNYPQEEFERKIKQLITFIESNHLYYGKTGKTLNIRTILPNMEYDPILKPKSFEVILRGMKLGLDYILQKNPLGYCNLLELNSCSIHEYKPIACKRYPYTKENCLRNDDYFLDVCSGLKKVKQV